MTALLTLSEFAAAAATAVQASGAAPDNRQAKAVPAERMVRYYTARGLLPRPGTRGRALTYGRTHLVRLVAIKRLQGEGLSLDDISQRLEAMSAQEVELLAAIPDDAMPPGLGDPESAPEAARAAGPFWRTVPEPAPAVATMPAAEMPAAEMPAAEMPAATMPAAEMPAAEMPSAERPPAHAPAVTSMQAVRLSDTVTLLIDGPLPPLDALRSAAQPLLNLLAALPDGTATPGKDSL